MQARLGALRQELETGNAELQNLERRQLYLRETTLRISGAIQILEEFLVKGETAGRDGAGPSATSSLPGQAEETTT
jgi:hypothetical protein